MPATSVTGLGLGRRHQSDYSSYHPHRAFVIFRDCSNPLALDFLLTGTKFELFSKYVDQVCSYLGNFQIPPTRDILLGIESYTDVPPQMAHDFRSTIMARLGSLCVLNGGKASIPQLAGDYFDLNGFQAPTHPFPDHCSHMAQGIIDGTFKDNYALTDALKEIGMDILAEHFAKEKHSKDCWAAHLIIGWDGQAMQNRDIIENLISENIKPYKVLTSVKPEGLV